MLPQKIYETLRWIVSVVLPATSVLFATLAGAWNWNLPVDAILATIAGLELFLGSIFGISKVMNDKTGE